ncbi:MAG: sigma-70 family RNA polymerase sigma factor [Thermoanaerobaculia bacterium]
MISNSETVYVWLRRLLFGALARLAREGFVVPPADAADLVHDFFVEVWPAVARGYDPNRGKLEAYAYRAFVHFARPRIVRMRRWRSRLVETAEIARLEPAPDQLSESGRDIAAVGDALAKLPPLHRDVLHAYLTSDLHSERALSDVFGLSRYRLREMLVEALGRVAVSLGEPGRIPQGDWEVARALWKEGRTAAEAAVFLGRTVEQVRKARERIGRLLSGGLSSARQRSVFSERRVIMPRDVQSLLKEVLASPGKQHLLDEVRHRAGEILDHLERAESLEEWGKASDDAEWLAEVYGAIAGDEELSSEDKTTLDAMVSATRGEESSIGYAFKEALIRNLPEEVPSLESRLAGLPMVDEEEQKELFDTPAVQAALPQAAGLIVYGVTPLTIFYATEAVGGLIGRLMRHRIVRLDADLVLEECDRVTPDRSPVMTTSRGFVLAHPMVLNEIVKVAECSAATAPVLLFWLVNVARFRPFVFRGLEAKPREGAVALTAVKDVAAVADDLALRWGQTGYVNAAPFVY